MSERSTVTRNQGSLRRVQGRLARLTTRSTSRSTARSSDENDDSSLDDTTSSSDTSSDDDDEDGDLNSVLIPSNHGQRARLYKLAIPSATVESLAQERRVSDRLGKALLDARWALLSKRWQELLGAIKAIENHLRSPTNQAALAWKLPILARVVSDSIIAVNAILPDKRSLAADEAKAVAALHQRLPRDPSMTPWSERVRAQTEGVEAPILPRACPASAAVVDSIEAYLLSPAFGRIELSNLDLPSMPEALTKVGELLDWYGLFGELPVGISDVREVEVSHNRISSLPPWLPQALPSLAVLNLSDNPLRVLSPRIVLLRCMERLTVTVPSIRITPTNASSLLKKAFAATQPTFARENIDSLVTACLRMMGASSETELLPHWQARLFNSYSCASCDKRLLCGDREHLPDPLVERIFLLYPPVRANTTSNGVKQPSQGISKTPFSIGGHEWRFCASCLVKHLTMEGGCECIVCREEARVLSEAEAVRWARRRIEV